ncbi:MAG: hypothetical protein KF729_19605 [Sandaracinaceae bacterium]|nr:hypothetical protein [Sandaracinaceae bacterium]
MRMRAGDAARVLGAIARHHELELVSGDEVVLDALIARGLVRAAPEPGPERARLDALRAELAAVGRVRAARPDDPTLGAEERRLRTEILERSEEVARSEGATVLRARGGGPYRGVVGPAARVQITQRGRALMTDLEPRTWRSAELTLDAFDAEMAALRALLDRRAARAAAILAHARARDRLGPAPSAALVGLSVLRAEPPVIARVLDAALTRLAPLDAAQPGAAAAGAECLCLASADLTVVERPHVTDGLMADVRELTSRFGVAFEDALDAAALLSHLPREAREARLALAFELASAMRVRGRAVSLAFALLAVSGESSVPAHLPAQLAALDDELAPEVSGAPERMATAVLLLASKYERQAQIRRWRTLRQYLARVSPDGMSVEAALLAWLALPVEEILHDLRLASQALGRHGVAGTGAETVAVASKLLLSMAAMAAGAEGDPEERLALAPLASPALELVGLGGALAALPLAALSAFHRTVLCAATAWEEVHHPTHSGYVYGGYRPRGHYRG